MGFRLKNIFDIFFSFIGLIITWWLIFLAWVIAAIETKSNGFFFQERVGQYGKIFFIIKIKTMSNDKRVSSNITLANDKRVTKSGWFFRKTKIDELPQLINVFKGDMSFVGPRPDVVGYADRLKGNNLYSRFIHIVFFMQI